MEESVFRETKRMDDLAKCGTVQDAFVQHGLAPDDKIDRREQVLMFRAVEKEMEMELKALMADGRFDEAKELGSRLESLRSEFGGLQLKDEMDRQKKQRRLFDKATKIKKTLLAFTGIDPATEAINPVDGQPPYTDVPMVTQEKVIERLQKASTKELRTICVTLGQKAPASAAEKVHLPFCLGEPCHRALKLSCYRRIQSLRMH